MNHGRGVAARVEAGGGLTRMANLLYDSPATLADLVPDFGRLVADRRFHNFITPVGPLVENIKSTYLNKITTVVHGPVVSKAIPRSTVKVTVPQEAFVDLDAWLSAAVAAAPRTDVEAYCRSLRAGQTARADPAYVHSPFFPAAFIEFQIWPALRRVLSNELPKTRSLAALRWLVSFGSDLALPSPELTRARRPLELIYATVWEIYDGAPPMPGESPQAVGLRPLNLLERTAGPGQLGGREGQVAAEGDQPAQGGQRAGFGQLVGEDPAKGGPDLELDEGGREEGAVDIGRIRARRLAGPQGPAVCLDVCPRGRRHFLVSGETLSEDISRLTGAAWRLCSRPLLYDAETGRVQIPLATEEEEEAVVAVKEKSVSSSPRHYSTDLQTLKSVVEGIQDVCRDAAARWALATADTATLRRRLLVPALRESRGIADHPLWAHTSEPLRPDLEELNERVEHALELGYSLTGALRRSVAYRFRDYTFARLFQPPAIDAERAEAIVRRDARPPPVFIPAPPC